MSKPLGNPVNLARWLGKDGIKVKNRVHRVGIELEGGWDKQPVGWVHDGSVRNLPGITGELPSPPIQVGEIQAWMERSYPPYVNETCGLHVHMSFENTLYYQQLMNPAFPATVIACISDWARCTGLPRTNPLWGRLAGKSEFCQHVYSADDQAIMTRKDHDRKRLGNRYSVMNYAYSRTQTIECRLLSMMPTMEESISAVQEVIRITNAFLVATSKKEAKHQLAVTDDGSDYREVFRVSA